MSSANWARVVNSTISEYIRKEEVNILRARKLLAALQSKGRISKGHEGTNLDWKVRYKRAPLQTYADSQQLSFPRREKRKTATLPWRAYAATDSMTKFERLQNKGTAAIIKIYANLAKELMEDVKDQFCEELFVDGNATGSTDRIHGLESFFGTNSQSGVIYINSDTYAGLTTGRGDYGGAWTGTWPAGYGDPQYDFWSPLILDGVNASWASGGGTWKQDCVEIVRYAILNTSRNADDVDLVLMEKDLFRVFADFYDDQQQINVNRGGGSSLLVKLGFGNVINFEGVDLTWEYGVPANTVYGLTMEKMELMSLQSQLFDSNMEDFDIEGMSHRFAVDFYGNMKCNPRNFFKIITT